MSKSLKLVATLAIALASPLFAQAPPETPGAGGAQEKKEAPPAPTREEAKQEKEALEAIIEQRPEIPTDKRGGRRVKLSLQDCLRLGGESNIDLRIDQLLELIAREDVVAEEGVFDVEFFLDGEWRRGESPERSSFQPSSVTKNYGGQAGLRKTFLSGAVVELAYGPGYTEQTVNSTFAFPNTFFSGGLTFALRQPLLRGAWWEYNEATILRAKHEYIARRHDFERNKQTILELIARAYYDLTFARENWIVSYKALELARERLRNTESRIRLGGLAPRDRVADEAEVARKQEELILAETTILDAEDVLRRLMLGFATEEDWDLILVPTVDLSQADPDIELPGWRDAAMHARKNRPDVLALMRRVQSARLSLTQADSELLPQLDFLARYSTAAQRDDFGAWNADAWEAEFPSYTLGFEFAVPLGNRVANARFEQARLTVRRLMTELSILHIDIIQDVRDAIRRLERLEKSIAAAEESVRLAKNNLESEQIKLRLDSSTQFQVQERANELSDAESRLIRSRLDYREAYFALLAVQGRLDEFSRLPEPKASRGEEEEPGK